MTEIPTGWTEWILIVVRETGLSEEAITRLRTLVPYPLRCVDCDNDSAFLSEAAANWCREHRPKVPRAPAYRNNV